MTLEELLKLVVQDAVLVEGVAEAVEVGGGVRRGKGEKSAAGVGEEGEVEVLESGGREEGKGGREEGSTKGIEH